MLFVKKLVFLWSYTAKNAVNYTGRLLAYKSNYDINVLQYQEEEITDFTYVNKVLEENGISTIAIVKNPINAANKILDALLFSIFVKQYNK